MKYTRQTSFQDNVPADGGQVRRELDGIAEATNNITNEQLSPTAGIDQTKLSGSTLHKSAMYVQSNTTNALTNNQVTYRGWGYIVGNSTANIIETVTIPNGGFDDANYSVSVEYTGDKATTPTGPGDVTSFNPNVSSSIKGSTAYSSTQFAVSLIINNGGGNFTANHVYTWIAIGTKA